MQVPILEGQQVIMPKIRSDMNILSSPVIFFKFCSTTHNPRDILSNTDSNHIEDMVFFLSKICFN